MGGVVPLLWVQCRDASRVVSSDGLGSGHGWPVGDSDRSEGEQVNYERFQQVAGDYEKGCFQEWTRNRSYQPVEELFEDWWSRSYTARDLKKTEKEYERYSTAKRSYVVDELTGDVAVFEPPKPTSSNVVDCPNCGVRLGLQALE